MKLPNLITLVSFLGLTTAFNFGSSNTSPALPLSKRDVIIKIVYDRIPASYRQRYLPISPVGRSPRQIARDIYRINGNRFSRYLLRKQNGIISRYGRNERVRKYLVTVKTRIVPLANKYGLQCNSFGSCARAAYRRPRFQRFRDIYDVAPRKYWKSTFKPSIRYLNEL